MVLIWQSERLSCSLFGGPLTLSVTRGSFGALKLTGNKQDLSIGVVASPVIGGLWLVSRIVGAQRKEQGCLIPVLSNKFLLSYYGWEDLPPTLTSFLHVYEVCINRLQAAQYYGRKLVIRKISIIASLLKQQHKNWHHIHSVPLCFVICIILFFYLTKIFWVPAI